MALVDYSSSEPEDDYDAGPGPAQSHRDEPRRSPTETVRSTSAAAAASSPQALESTSEHQPFASALPPLPPSFYDLYASTVRTATADLPSLHEGRRRIIPHKDGNWPSHIYLEWHPTSSQHQLLQSLLAALARDLHCLLTGHGLTGCLTSDLGAPLPLHVSLSRPFVLRNDEKDAFFELLVRDTARCRVPTFTLACGDLSWHRSPESARSFLVLRVRGRREANDELSALLRACNRLVASYGQPELYAPTGPSNDNSSHVSDAFHVSLAWSFAEPTAEMRRMTAEVFARPGFRDSILSSIRIPVEGVKVKIGNVVKNIALPETGGRSGSEGVKGLFAV